MSNLKQYMDSYLRQALGPLDFNRWAKPLVWNLTEDGQAAAMAPTPFHARHLTANHLPLLKNALVGAGLKIGCITYSERTRVFAEETSTPACAPLQGWQALAWPHLFSTGQNVRAQDFITGQHNYLAASALKEVAAGGDLGTSTIYISGAGSFGKTMLLDCLAEELLAGSTRVCLGKICGGQFLEMAANGGQPDFTAQWARMWRLPSLVIFDDVHLLSGQPRIQDLLVSAIDLLHSAGALIVFSGRPKVKDLPGFNDALASRLGGGLNLELSQPDYKFLEKFLLFKANAAGLNLSDATRSSIILHLGHDLRAYEGYLSSLLFVTSKARDGLSRVESLAQELLPKLSYDPRQKKVPLDYILHIVADSFGLKVTDLKSSSKSRQVAWPRRVAMYLARELTSLTTTDIGVGFGGRDHSTVIHALRRMADELSSNATQAQVVDNLRRAIIAAL